MFDLRAHGLSAAVVTIFVAFLAILSGLLLLVASFSVEVVTLAAFSAVTSSTVTITFARLTHPPLVVMVGVVMAVALIALIYPFLVPIVVALVLMLHRE